MFESVKLEESSVAYFVIGIQRFNLYKSLKKFNFTLGSEFQKFVKELLFSVRNMEIFVQSIKIFLTNIKL